MNSLEIWKKLIDAKIKKGISDLRYADLRSANLRNADLRYADYDTNKYFISNFCRHNIFADLTIKTITIGCKSHSFEHWLRNYTKIGISNNYTSTEIKMYYAIINIITELKV